LCSYLTHLQGISHSSGFHFTAGSFFGMYRRKLIEIQLENQANQEHQEDQGRMAGSNDPANPAAGLQWEFSFPFLP
jgi:hypothetical protein